jgi:hypothetical protein
MSEVRLDGLLRVHDPSLLTTLAPPWSRVGQADEVALEVKMQGDHSDLLSFDRASLHRLARQVQRREDRPAFWAMKCDRRVGFFSGM